MNWVNALKIFFLNLFKGKRSESSEPSTPVEKLPEETLPVELPPVEIPNSDLPSDSRPVGLFPDISRYEPCDFSKFEGFDLITKATDGDGWIDPTLKKNIDGCKSKNIRLGVYHFYRVGDDPIVQAKHFINSVGFENLKSFFYEPILDYETVTNKKVGPLQSEADMKLDVADAKIFLKYIYEQTGRKCMFYTYESLLAYLELDEEFKNLCSRLWIARYGKKPSRFKPWLEPWAYQYSDGEYSNTPPWSDSFKGIGRCDANIIWKDIK